MCVASPPKKDFNIILDLENFLLGNKISDMSSSSLFQTVDKPHIRVIPENDLKGLTWIKRTVHSLIPISIYQSLGPVREAKLS